jgi:hypothetical protein
MCMKTSKMFYEVVVSSTPHLNGFELTTLVVTGTDCIDSYMITTTTVPLMLQSYAPVYLSWKRDGHLCFINTFFHYLLNTVDHIVYVHK